MKRLASTGRGLSTYISRYGGEYAEKLASRQNRHFSLLPPALFFAPLWNNSTTRRKVRDDFVAGRFELMKLTLKFAELHLCRDSPAF